MLGVHGLAAPTAQTILGWMPRLAWLMVLAAAAVLSARWLTLFVSPRPVALAVGQAQLASPALGDALAVFGSATVGGVRGVEGFELTGVYVSSGDRGFATFSSPQGPLSVVVGEELRPGLVLASVTPGHAVLRGGGSEWQLDIKSAPAVREGLIRHEGAGR